MATATKTSAKTIAKAPKAQPVNSGKTPAAKAVLASAKSAGTASAGKTAAAKAKKSPAAAAAITTEFDSFLIDELKDIYWAEKHLVKALPKMRKAATSSQLAMAFEKHTADTEQHIKLIEQAFELLGKKAQAKKCEAMAGLIAEAQGIIEDTESGTLIRDAGLILAAQKVEHYEIATYGTLRTLASHGGKTEVAALLEQILRNEKETDAALTQVAESFVNEQAAQE